MADGQSMVRRKRPVFAAAVFLLLFWYLLALLLFIATKVHGYGFVPSAEWASRINGFGIAAGFILGLLTCGIMLFRSDPIPGGYLKRSFAILLCPLLGFVLGRIACVLIIPLVLAIVAGHHVELAFTVEDVAGYSDRGCRSPVELQDLPPFLDSLCGVSNGLQGTLAPGTRIIVDGYGTSFGLYATSLRTAVQ